MNYIMNVKINGQWVGIPVMQGQPGKTMELRKQDNLLQWKYEEETESAWRTLFDFSTIVTVKGDKGDPGDPGVTPHIGENGNWFIGETDTMASATGKQGAPGYTPQRGIDYWTEDDKNEIKSYVEEAILNGEW